MDTVTPKKGKARGRDRANRIKKAQSISGKKPDSKGTMREPTQQASARGTQEELKEALQNLEEQKGDWSRGG